MEQQQQPNKFVKWIKNSSAARMIMIGFLSLILMIPLMYIEGLIHERSYRQKSVVNEIGKQWGNEVVVYGPILKVPYKVFTETIITDKKTKKVTTETIERIKYGYFFPNKLDINSAINPEEKKRGIYTTAVFNSKIDINGSFDSIDFSKLEIKQENILWNKSKVLLKTTNVKGVNSVLSININDKKLGLSSANSNRHQDNGYYTLETDKFSLNELQKNTKSLKFRLDFDVRGSKEVRFIPIGKETTAQITSSWKTAKFMGEFLPFNPDKINDNGFDAKWKILDVNRPFSQQHFNGLPHLNEFDFGVNFKIPVDEYQKSERSAKYGFLVIVLTFLVFFLIQTISKINMHPFQYLMIGLALLMFYTLLVSISEHSNFLKAYAIASISVISLITIYAKNILKSIKFMLLIGVSLTVLYAFIFIIIQLESYALLVGSVGLFLILATVMFVSRKIDWSNS
ncbi:cell envelope integrity protein CreD [Tenacibaculum todarodis]|uniref:Cell envelope integrity protein CreD n=1 Tax=Tenacibaculum todarodis TaxID=1850252 RepID=A0A1L3JHE2_9FLAO|nr:cell envelope integrity protein CreD [Tenacibaculum todarodis]APG64539.1 cell envelope integrity protein CreD [Tenacibaculum todarodis]